MYAKLTGKITRNPQPDSDYAVVIVSITAKPESYEQEKCEQERLAETMRVVRRNFARVDIVVVAEPHMLTKAISDPRHDPEAMRGEATQEGKDWIARSQSSIGLLNYTDSAGVIHSKLQRVLEWGECVAEKKDDYERLLNWLRERYADLEDPFKKILDTSAISFLRRMQHEKKFSSEEMPRLLSFSREYILQECALTLAWKYQFLIYSGQVNPAILYLIEDWLHNKEPEILQVLTVTFPKQEFTDSSVQSTPAIDGQSRIQRTRELPRKREGAHSDGDVSPKPESASGCIEGVAKHREELIADPSTSAAECPDELLSPHAQKEAKMRKFVSQAEDLASVLDPTSCLELMADLSCVFSRRSRKPPRYGGFHFDPPRQPLAPSLQQTPPDLLVPK